MELIAENAQALLAVAGVFAVLIAMWVFAPGAAGAGGGARRHLGTHRLALGSIVVVLLGNVLLTVPFADWFRNAGLNADTFLLAALATQGPMLAVIFLRVVLPGAASWRDLGLRALPPGQLVRWGLGTGLLSLVVVMAIGFGLSQLGITQNQLEGQFGFVRGLSRERFFLMLLVGAVVAPWIEELFFRGFIFGSYAKRKPLWMAYLVSGVLFALPHANPATMNGVQTVGLMIPIFALGTLFAWTYRRTGSLLPSMIGHSFNNAFSLVVLYVLGAR